MERLNNVWILLAVCLIQLLGLHSLLIGLVGEKKVETEVTPIPRRVYNEPFIM
jgi:hypothetical protein